MDILKGAKTLLRYRRKARIDNVVFVLHKVTAGVLLTLSFLVSMGVYVKQPIVCVSDKTISRVIDAYCWIHSTFTIPNKTNEDLREIVAAHPGVAQDLSDDEIRVHKYYQWVCFVLFFQAAAFYLPRMIWKRLEKGRIHTLSSMGSDDMNKDDPATGKKRKECVDYFQRSLGSNDGWAMNYGLCEILAFINVVIQIDLTDRFVGRALSTYGLSLMQFSRDNPLLRTDAMAKAFPTVTKCVFNMVGPTGNIIRFDNLCVLPLNIYNEKFYPLLWIWFIILAVLSGLAILYRIFTFLIPELRHELLKRRFDVAQKEIPDLGKVNMKLDYGDWFLLYHIGKNMDPASFSDFLNELVQRIIKDVLPSGVEQRIVDKQKYL